MRYLKCYCLALLLNLPGVCFGQAGLLTIESVEQHPAIVFENQPFELLVVGYHVGFPYGSTHMNHAPNEGSKERISVAVDGNDLAVEFSIPYLCMSPQPPLPPNDKPQLKILPMPGLPAGDYTLNLTHAVNCESRRFSRRISIYPNPDQLAFNQESPSEQATVSGVGLIRGWACYQKPYAQTYGNGGMAKGTLISEVAYQIDNGDLVPLLHGSERGDTEAACGENNIFTGYGGVIYWGLFGAGDHTFSLYIDGKSVESFDFTIAAPSAGFLKGIEEEFVLENFPTMGNSVRARWSEADQNFVIVDYN